MSIPVDGGGLLTSWFNLDLQPRIAENGEDVIFGPDHTSTNSNGSGKEDYPVLETGSRSVTASATASVQSMQMRGSRGAARWVMHRALRGVARVPMQGRMSASARHALAFGA